MGRSNRPRVQRLKRSLKHEMKAKKVLQKIQRELLIKEKEVIEK